jgi:hypothetical protein
MKRIGARLLAVLAGSAALVQVVTLSGEASTALRFSGLRHIALGAASLDPRLLVSNLATAGDGVSIMTRRARGWSAGELRVVPRTLDWSVKFEAEGRVGRERTAPTLSVRELKDAGRDRFSHRFRSGFRRGDVPDRDLRRPFGGVRRDGIREWQPECPERQRSDL